MLVSSATSMPHSPLPQGQATHTHYRCGMSEPDSVVRECLQLLADGDGRAAVALLDPEVEWKNTGLPTLRGKRAHGAFLSMEQRGIGFDVEMHHLAVDGDVVLTDRTDTLAYGRFRTSFWVCGTFRVRESRIVLWDDHFSMGNVTLGALKGLVGIAG